MNCDVPVVTLDGYGGTGKGPIGRRLAYYLGWHFLDSGVLYRLVAFAAAQQGIYQEDTEALAQLAQRIQSYFQIRKPDPCTFRFFWQGEDMTAVVRGEACSEQAAQLSAIPEVRTALLEVQRDTRRPPGLIADGRDMGSVVFPDACLKYFLIASLAARAVRLHWQLKQQGKHVSLPDLKTHLMKRDMYDSLVAKTAPDSAQDAEIINMTELSVDIVFSMIQRKLLSMGIRPMQVEQALC
jgi:cytidylate kinase